MGCSIGSCLTYSALRSTLIVHGARLSAVMDGQQAEIGFHLFWNKHMKFGLQLG